MAHEKSALPSVAVLADWVRDARRRTCALVADLADPQLLGAQLSIVNPLLWQIGNVAWLQEKWVLRRDGQAPLLAQADELYDSAIPHAARWKLPLPTRADTVAYLERVRDRVLECLQEEMDADQSRLVMLAVFLEDMHGEAIAATRQTLGYPPPRLETHAVSPGAETQVLGALAGDVDVPACRFNQGADRAEPFAFDNEWEAHQVDVREYRIARAPVTQEEFLAFVERGGYYRPDLWCHDGWHWRQAVDARHPVYWKRATGGAWLRRHYDAWVPLEPHHPVVHVNWFEAEAYCRWVGRRLPTEVEWEVAAAFDPGASDKRRFPWGNTDPTAAQANLDGRQGNTVNVAALPAGESACGCRQLIGNVWEWTASDFLPYPGFVPGPWKAYSEPFFGTHKVLRGGSWATRARLLRNTYRNFFTPDRRDLWAGFRTCAS